MPQNGRPSDEQTPLLQAPPTTVDASNEAIEPDSLAKEDARAKISIIRGTLCVVALGFLILLQATNISLLTVSQSAIAADLDAFEQTSWFTSAYLIAMSSTSPINGKLSQVFTPRISIFVSTIVLGLGTLLTAFAESFIIFIVGRALTGIGAAGIFTVSIIIVIELSSAKSRGLFMGLLNAGYTIGVAGGATLAGALLPATGWRALFWLQTPVSIIAGIMLFIAMPRKFALGKEDKGSMLSQLGRLDYFGALSLTASIVLFLFSLSSPSGIPILPIIASLIILAAFLLNEIYLAHDPIIPISLLRSRGLLLTCLGTVGYMMSRWTILFYTPTYAIAVRSWSPSAAGSILIPTNGGFAIGGLLVGWLHIRRHGSFYIPSLVVYALFPLTLVALAMIASTHNGSVVLYVAIVFVNGFVTGAALNYTLAHLLHLTPAGTHYVATSLIATFRGFAGSFASAIGGGLFTRVLKESLSRQFSEHGLVREDLIRQLLGSPALVPGLRGVEHEVAVLGYQEALRALWLAAAGLAALMVIVQAGTGWKGASEDRIVEEEADRLAERREEE
ncbi:hypothetical protein MBLNU457_g0684t1 [Dothideomycetes sp. NU457]